MAVWGAAPYALVLNGRSEHLEKYGPIMGWLARHGYGALSLDWRGQGLSDRLHPRNLGHVRDFEDYQLDLDAALKSADIPAEEIPLLLSHSTGGIIGLRYILRTSHIRAAVLSGPLLGLRRRGPADSLLQHIVRIAARGGFAMRLLPGSTLEPTVIATPFEGNPLTSSRERWELFRHQIATCPELGVGGTTIGWAAAAIRDMNAARRWQVPEVPLLMLLGSSEDIVSVPDVRAFAARAPRARLVEVPGAEHEVLMEAPEVEARVWAEVARFLDEHGLPVTRP